MIKSEVGKWYVIEHAERCEVVAFDEDDGCVELQYGDGTVEEMDIEDWNGADEDGNIKVVSPPFEEGYTHEDVSLDDDCHEQTDDCLDAEYGDD